MKYMFLAFWHFPSFLALILHLLQSKINIIKQHSDTTSLQQMPFGTSLAFWHFPTFLARITLVTK
jgi:hypothetical protein